MAIEKGDWFSLKRVHAENKKLQGEPKSITGLQENSDV
jgi:hypothetical protein